MKKIRVYTVNKADYKMGVALVDNETEHYFTASKGEFRLPKNGLAYNTYKSYEDAVNFRKNLIKKDIQNAKNVIAFAEKSLLDNLETLKTVKR